MGEVSLASHFPNLFLYARDRSMLVWDCFSKNGDQVVWGLTFRRNLDEVESEELVALMAVLDSVFIAGARGDKRVWMGTVDGSFSVASFFTILLGPALLTVPFDQVCNMKALP